MRVISVLVVLASILGLFSGISGLMSISSITAYAASLGTVVIEDKSYDLDSEHPYYVVVPETVEVGKAADVFIGGNVNGSVCVSVDRLLAMTEESGATEVCTVKLGKTDRVELVGTSSSMSAPSVASGELLVNFKDGAPLQGKWSGRVDYVLSEEIECDMTDSLTYKLSADGTYYTITGVKDKYIFTHCDDRLYFPSYYNGKPIKAIGDNAFYAAGLHPLNGISNQKHEYTVIIPETITSIGNFAFTYFGGEGTKFYFDGSSIEKIGDKAFRYSYMTNIFLPSSVETIGDMAFGNTHIETFEFPESIKTLSGHAFYYCSRLESLNLPESITKMGIDNFIGCSNLKSVVWNCSLSEIPSGSFNGCKSLESFTMNSSAEAALKTIGSKAFLKCVSLKSFIIPSGVTLVGDYAFYSSGIESIGCPTAATTYTNSFPVGCEVIRT